MELTLIFYAIQIAKSFYDHGRFDVFKKAFPQHILREDSFYELQELALDIVSEFHCFNQKLDYEYDISSYYHYFSSENMTAYIRLCRQYESLLHMKPEENPFWREASTCIKNALWLDSYCYDWALKEKTGKKFSSGIVFAYDVCLTFSHFLIRGYAGWKKRLKQHSAMRGVRNGGLRDGQNTKTGY